MVLFMAQPFMLFCKQSIVDLEGTTSDLIFAIIHAVSLKKKGHGLFQSSNPP